MSEATNIVVYTAIFGGYDVLYPPAAVDPAVSYVCLTDDTSFTPPAPWELRKVTDGPSNPRRHARWCKVLSHRMFPCADVTIWHGGNVELLARPQDMLQYLADSDIATVRHNQRSCIYQEARACAQWKKDDHNVIKQQMARYRADGYPSHRGLSSTFVLLRRHLSPIRALNIRWWKEIANGSVRDQLSFDYVCWKLGIAPTYIPGTVFEGEHYRRHARHVRQTTSRCG